MQRAQGYPKCKRRIPQPLQDGEVLLLGVLALWRISPSFFFDDGQDPGNSWIDSAIRVWESSLDNSVKASTMVNFIIISQPLLRAPALGGRLEAVALFMVRAL